MFNFLKNYFKNNLNLIELLALHCIQSIIKFNDPELLKIIFRLI